MVMAVMMVMYRTATVITSVYCSSLVPMGCTVAIRSEGQHRQNVRHSTCMT